jgi:hypothetical protein
MPAALTTCVRKKCPRKRWPVASSCQRTPTELRFGSGSARYVHFPAVNRSADAPSNVTTQLPAAAQDTAATPE